jgi:hypothetical protein
MRTHFSKHGREALHGFAGQAAAHVNVALQ